MNDRVTAHVEVSLPGGHGMKIIGHREALTEGDVWPWLKETLDFISRVTAVDAYSCTTVFLRRTD